MIQPDKLDAAMLNVATMMDAEQPKVLLRRWLRHLPATVYPFIVAEYRVLTSQPSFAVLVQGAYSAQARALIQRFKATSKQPWPPV